MKHERIEKLRRRRSNTPEAVLLPALSTDLETVLDVLDVVGRRWVNEAVPEGGVMPHAVQTFWVTSGEVARAKLAELSVHERNSLRAQVTVRDRTMEVICELGTVGISPEGLQDTADAERDAVRILMEGSSRRITWRRLRVWLPLVPAVLVVLSALLLVVTPGMHPAAITGIIGATVLLAGFSFDWFRRLKRENSRAAGPIRFRAQSRQDLYASRADRMANVKVALITAPISIAAALFIAWATGFIAPRS